MRYVRFLFWLAACVLFLIVARTPLEADDAERDPAQAVDRLSCPEDLTIELFAAEPMLVNPSNIDVDHLGRVWVCEIANYRPDRNRENPVREEGDRILVLEDTDQDGKADKRTVFFQSPEIDSPHGVLVLGDRVIVSASGQILSLFDDDGDLRADRQEVLFTGIDGAQHDHGIHSVCVGPDQRLYFCFGNAGNQLRRPDGSLVVDRAGNEVTAKRSPYQQGMAFRCELDGSDVETIGWNFRNNWELAVDSFGNVWQSDNDDDGNRSVRINFVMEFGNYGRNDEMTGASWKTPRTGWHPEVASRHWHQNDPGVVPNLLHTGAGSPVGIAVYEGQLLPKRFRGELLHCDAGPRVVRAYPVEPAGAGFTASIENIVTGEDDPWFRPTDVCVAPDGTLLVSDWYDPGVGGHRAFDDRRGRIFRVLPAGENAGARAAESAGGYPLTTPSQAAAALKSPNETARYLAAQALLKAGERSVAELERLFRDDDPRVQARALWLLAMLPDSQKYLDEAFDSEDANLRVTGVRAARRVGVEPVEVVQRLKDDPSAAVRRELLIALSESESSEVASLWADLARRGDPSDRWYLEALGIAARGRWDACLEEWLEAVGGSWTSESGRQIVWRSRGLQTPRLLHHLLRDPQLPDEEVPRLMRAFDFQDPSVREPVLRQLAFERELETDRDYQIAVEALVRLPTPSEAVDGITRARVDQLLDRTDDLDLLLTMARRFGLRTRTDDLFRIAIDQPRTYAAVRAIGLLLDWDQADRIETVLRGGDVARGVNMAEALRVAGDLRAKEVLLEVVQDESVESAVRRAGVRALAARGVSGMLLVRMAQDGELDDAIRDVTIASLHGSDYSDVRVEAAKLFPPPAAKGDHVLPPVGKLADRRGDIERGAEVFRKAGTCSNCHIVNGQGKEIGPDLSGIGQKLSRQALYESILFPSAGISLGYENWSVLTVNGQVVTGLLASETDDAVTIKSAEGVLRQIPRGNIEVMKQQQSMMPENLPTTLTEQQLVDVVEYLTTLRQTKQ